MFKYFFILISLCFVPICIFGQGQDSIRLRQISTGIYGHVESISEKVFSSNTGYGLGLGVYQERKLLGKVNWSYGGGVRYKSYFNEAILVDTTPIPDTSTDTSIIVNVFETQRTDLKFSTGISIKFVYIDDPKIYLIVGLGPEITFNQKIAATYKSTRYVDEDFIDIGTSTTDPPEFEDDDFRINGVNFRFDIGFGIELKRFNIELVNRTDNVHGIGIRLRYRFDTLVY